MTWADNKHESWRQGWGGVESHGRTPQFSLKMSLDLQRGVASDCQGSPVFPVGSNNSKVPNNTTSPIESGLAPQHFYSGHMSCGHCRSFN